MSSKIKFLQHYVILDFIQLWGEFCLFFFFLNYAYYAQHRMSFNAQGKPEKWFHISALQPDVFGKHTEIGPSLNYNIRQKRKGGKKKRLQSIHLADPKYLTN